MKKLSFLIFLSVFLLACAHNSSLDDPNEGPVEEPTPDYLNEIEFPPFAFTLPQDWSAEEAMDGEGFILSFPDTSHLRMILEEDSSSSALPKDLEAATFTDEGIAIYNIGCGGPYYCGNLSYDGHAYDYAFFEVSLGDSSGENRIAEILPPSTSITHEELAAFIETVHLVR